MGNIQTQAIGTQIKFFREKKGITQSQLAEITGISSKQVVSAIERNLYSPSVKTLKVIADKLGCKLNLFMTE